MNYDEGYLKLDKEVIFKNVIGIRRIFNKSNAIILVTLTIHTS